MSETPFRLSLPITCDCGRAFKIDPTGVQPWTDIVCPSCHNIDHVSQETVDQVVEDYMDAMGELYEDEDEYQAAMSILIDAPDKERAEVIDN